MVTPGVGFEILRVLLSLFNGVSSVGFVFFRILDLHDFRIPIIWIGIPMDEVLFAKRLGLCSISFGFQFPKVLFRVSICLSSRCLGFYLGLLCIDVL